MSKKQILIIFVAIAVVGAALFWAFIPKPVIVEVTEVTRGRFEQTIDEDGKTRVRERYVVSAPLAGRVQRITLKAGDAVARGDVVAVMHPAAPPLIDARAERELEERIGVAQAALARARTAVAHARTALAQNRADAKRTQALATQGFVSAAQLEHDALKVTLSAREAEAAEFERHATEHQLELARAALTRSRQDWNTAGSVRAEQLDIRSPVAGRVLHVTQESEAVATLGAPLIEIGDPADLEIVVDVLSSDAMQIAPGQTVKLERQGGTETRSPLDGKVRRVEPSAFTRVSALGVEEQRVNVVIDITTPRVQWPNLGDGYRVDARIVVYHVGDAIKVPVAALFRDGAQWAVFVADGGIARKRVIETSRRSSREALVEKGLAPGVQVILYPGNGVRNGRRISIRNTANRQGLVD